MELREQRLVIILADISGYTRFMVANQLSAIHGQLFINGLIETLLREVDIPLQLQEIEGDAVFLYATHPGDERGWQAVLAEVRQKRIRFSDVFLEAMVTLKESTICKCAICAHVDEMSLKIVVHTGRAVFHSVGGRPQVSGADVILAHRLLKNSVPSHEYLLMSEPAHRDLGAGMELAFQQSSESYDEFGTVPTYVHLMAETTERMRDSLYGMEPAALASRGRGYARISLLPHFSAVIDPLRLPSVNVGWPKRAAHVAAIAAQNPAT
jgi:class 3 adenylate cyclase